MGCMDETSPTMASTVLTQAAIWPAGSSDVLHDSAAGWDTNSPELHDGVTC